MLDENLTLRLLIFTLFIISLYISRLLSGRSIENIPFWNGLGMFVLYVCYSFSGIQFGNAYSGEAELAAVALVATSIGSFAFGERLISRGKTSIKLRKMQEGIHKKIRHFPAIPRSFLWMQVILSGLFYIILTKGELWKIITDPSSLKMERLYGIANKSPILLSMEGIIIAITLLGLSWSILSYRDDIKSKSSLKISIILTSLYVLSTGSRTPVIAIILQILPAINEAKLYSRYMQRIVKQKWKFILALFFAVTVMILVTGSRMDAESLSNDVFHEYFNIIDFGISDALLSANDSTSFFMGTAITYAANTFNNLIIRYQEIDNINPTWGYNFLYFYISFIQIISPDALENISVWRDMATFNKEYLESISMAAGQWSTPYGDLIWNFGVTGTFVIVAILGFLAGIIIETSRKKPSFSNILLKVIIIGFSLSPLVNSFLSIYVHFILILVIIIKLKSKKYRHH